MGHSKSHHTLSYEEKTILHTEKDTCDHKHCVNFIQLCTFFLAIWLFCFSLLLFDWLFKKEIWTFISSRSYSLQPGVLRPVVWSKILSYQGNFRLNPGCLVRQRLCFFLYFTRLYHDGNLCCRFHMLRSRLCSRLEINWYEITADPKIVSPILEALGVRIVGISKVLQSCLKPFPDEHQ